MVEILDEDQSIVGKYRLTSEGKSFVVKTMADTKTDLSGARVEESLSFGHALDSYRLRTAEPHTKLLYPRLLEELGEIAGRKIVDLGCGDGTFSALLMQSRPQKVTGVDINHFLLSLGQERNAGAISFIQSDISRKVALSNHEADLLVCSCVFMHLDNRELETASFEMFRILSPGGRAIIAVVHMNWAQRMYQLDTHTDGTATTIKSEHGTNFVERYRPGDYYAHVFKQSGFTVVSRRDIVIPADVPLSDRYSAQAGHPLFETFTLGK